ERGNEALGAFENIDVIADRAAGDDDGVAEHAWSAPRVELQGGAPEDVAGLGVEAEQGAIADLFLVEIRGAGEHPLADDVDRGIDVPFVLALLPEPFDVGLEGLVLARRHREW